MPQNEAAAIHPISGGTFSRLLFSDIEVDDTAGLLDHPLSADRFTFSTDKNTPKMLCFGAPTLSPKMSTTEDNNDSSSPLVATTSLSSNSNLKRNIGCDYHQPVVLPTTSNAAAPPVRTTGRTNKKMRTENTPPASHAKVKKEKLGERIAALQQMVSPYGKTDTASVLHEAMGYIKFLQEQVHVLCSPYLHRLPPAHIEGEEDVGGKRKKDLRARGLCLVPVDCTLHVAESNGADMWSPAMVNISHGSSSALH
ncbi:hypothetical protein L1987_78595 [Smallanthus sonchifolius]|uniref:Uncharacterized protein n=1 Tax=Smallanthus sonchifolius TaxID=185202 RepID=A0ACB8ZCT0_9ASTR|nr:hypothetical protein L1987_78595 [Smallanthus sonchifolius]